jgi:hypothetical protein
MCPQMYGKHTDWTKATILQSLQRTGSRNWWLRTPVAIQVNASGFLFSKLSALNTRGLPSFLFEGSEVPNRWCVKLTALPCFVPRLSTHGSIPPPQHSLQIVTNVLRKFMKNTLFKIQKKCGRNWQFSMHVNSLMSVVCVWTCIFDCVTSESKGEEQA